MRPEHPDAFVHRPETNAVNLSTERSTCGPPVVHFRRKSSSRGFGASHS
jgi:hypothetical protein